MLPANALPIVERGEEKIREGGEKMFIAKKMWQKKEGLPKGAMWQVWVGLA